MGFKPVERKEKKKKVEQTMKKKFLRRIHSYDSYEIFVKLNEKKYSERKFFECFKKIGGAVLQSF